MRIILKVLLGLALVVPMGAYVAGALATSSADRPAPRETIVIDDSGASGPGSHQPARHPSPTQGPSRSPGVGQVELDPDDIDSDDDDWGRENDHADDHAEDHSDDHSDDSSLSPSADPSDDRSDGHGSGDSGGSGTSGSGGGDNSGHGSDDGGGGDDHSGHGGGGGDD